MIKKESQDKEKDYEEQIGRSEVKIRRLESHNEALQQ